MFCIVESVSNFPQNFIVATSSVTNGNMSFRYGEKSEVLTSRKAFLNSLGLNYDNCVSMRSEHENIIRVVTNDQVGRGATDRTEAIQADALITQEINAPLLLTTADCLPISLFDPKTNTIALIHLSRHTFVLDLLEKTLTLLVQEFGAHPEDLVVIIGPHIKKDSYHFPEPLTSVHPKLAAYIYSKDERAHIDLLSATLAVLHKNNVAQNRIEVSPVNTHSDLNYFSHVRASEQGEPEGRLATVLCLTS